MSPEPLLEVSGLSVRLGGRDVVRGVSFSVAAGRCLAIVGESGSGKSVTARALLGLHGRDAQVGAEKLAFRGRDLLRLGARGWREVRGAGIGYVGQEALSGLDPLRRIGNDVAEAARVHRRRLGIDDVAAHTHQLLRDVGLPEPELRARQYPHELSGGMRQRALVAAGLAARPDLLIADEPTTALDATVQAQILALLRTLADAGTGLLLISHDLALVESVADEVAVMRDGEIVEQGPTAAVLAAPTHAYTSELLDAVPGRRPRPAPRPAADATGPLVEVRDVSRSYPLGAGREVKALDGVSLRLEPGEAVGLVGESGSGKSTLGRVVLGLTEPDAGEVRLDGEPWSGLDERRRRDRRSRLQLVHQDPLSSFDPRWTVARTLEEAVTRSGLTGRAQVRDRARELLQRVGLPEELLTRRPARMSGGQRQRVAIARALATGAGLLVCDEPVSALDVTSQAQILDLLAQLRSDLGTGLLFVSHDLAVVREVCERLLVMKDGRVVESGPTESVFTDPQHPYTRELLAAAHFRSGSQSR